MGVCGSNLRLGMRHLITGRGVGCRVGRLVIYYPETMRVYQVKPIRFTATPRDVARVRMRAGVVDLFGPIRWDVQAVFPEVLPVGVLSFAVVYDDLLLVADGMLNLLSYNETCEVNYRRVEDVKRLVEEAMLLPQGKLRLPPRDEVADRLHDVQVAQTQAMHARIRGQSQQVRLYAAIQEKMRYVDDLTEAERPRAIEEIKAMCLQLQDMTKH
jgi:hypothetical protein